MAVGVEPFLFADPSRWKEFVRFMAVSAFPFHMNPLPTCKDLESCREEGDLDGPESAVFATQVRGELVGFIAVEDPESIAPLLDIRLASGAHGKGLGTEIIRKFVYHLLQNYPNTVRTEGQTREDNVTTRRAFFHSDFVKEAYYRKAWPTTEGPLRDAIAYGLLRSDLETGQTTPFVRGGF